MKKVFLGGTCNESSWRDSIIPKLKINYFNPVVDDWTPACQRNEELQKKICAIHLYVITPAMTGVFSIAEAVHDSDTDPKGTVFCVLKHADGKSFEKFQSKSLDAVSDMIKKNGSHVCSSLTEVVKILNSFK